MPTQPALLLYSLAEYRELIFDVLARAGARTIVEVGSESGTFTRELATWAQKEGGAVTCIDPAPADELRALSSSGLVRLVEDRSPAALRGQEPADAYVLDGDHNYATVRGELDAIDVACFRAGRDPLVVLHDVGWPWARRDLYYDPKSLPADAVHPHAFDRGVAVGEPGLVAGGFRGEGRFAVAEREGGPRNGVLTAVEDFLAGRDDLAFLSCPLVFGVGFLFRRAAAWAGEVDSAVRPFSDEPLLARVEENRLALYLRVIEHQDRRADSERAVAQLRAALAAERAEVAAERAERTAAEARLNAMQASLSHRIAGRVQGLKERIAPPGTGRRAVADAAIAAVKRPLNGRPRR